MSNIKPIQTHYRGYRFRSRLEARWAVFFDALGIKWEYELQGYDLGELGWYLPDFWLPDALFYAEVKPTEPEGNDLARLDYFDIYAPEPSLGLLWLIGSPTLWDTFPSRDGSGSTWHCCVRCGPFSSDAIERAVEVSRSARFEHGDSPWESWGTWTPTDSSRWKPRDDFILWTYIHNFGGYSLYSHNTGRSFAEIEARIEFLKKSGLWNEESIYERYYGHP